MGVRGDISSNSVDFGGDEGKARDDAEEGSLGSLVFMLRWLGEEEGIGVWR